MTVRYPNDNAGVNVDICGTEICRIYRGVSGKEKQISPTFVRIRCPRASADGRLSGIVVTCNVLAEVNHAGVIDVVSPQQS